MFIIVFVHYVYYGGGGKTMEGSSAIERLRINCADNAMI